MKACMSLLAIFLTASVIAYADEGDAPGKFKIITKKKDDSVEVRAEKDKAVFVVKSPSGISPFFIAFESSASGSNSSPIPRLAR